MPRLTRMPSLNAPSCSYLSVAAVTAVLFACQSPPAPASTLALGPSPASAPGGHDTAPVAASSEPVAAAPSPPETRPPPAREEPSALPTGTTILHVGDSFAESLGAPLGRRLHAAGIRSVLESKTPSYIPTWAGNGELARLLDKHNPDLVLITLGGNEFEIPTPSDRVEAVKRLVRLLAERPCVWITPPRWKRDSGVLDVIKENSAPCRYLDSDAVVHELPRARDKIHPNEVGRERWAEAVLAWLKAERAPRDGQPWALKR